MRPICWTKWALVCFGAFVVIDAAPGRAGAGSDRAAAILIYPYIAVDSAQGRGTFLQLTNKSTRTPVAIQCFLENATSHCSDSLRPCSDEEGCAEGASCVTGWSVTDFRLELTPGQPIGWNASHGLMALPCSDGSCPAWSSGSIPPVPEDPFVGSLLCFAIDHETDAPNDRNVLTGKATTIRYQPLSGGSIDAASYNAIGIEAIPGANNGDNSLVLGGPRAEYRACPDVVMLDHFFDGAIELSGSREVFTNLVLVPCSQDPVVERVSGQASIQYEVFNEFEQRFSATRDMECFFMSRLSRIDATEPENSIWSVLTAGTVVGQTRMRASGSGVLAIAVTEHRNLNDPADIASAAFNTHWQGERAQEDIIGPVLPFCGNGIVEDLEQCDDGNTTDGDGCSANCEIENHPPECSRAAAEPDRVWPPDHQFLTASVGGVTDPDGDRPSITLTGITQDEPPDATNAHRRRRGRSPRWCADNAVLVGEDNGRCQGGQARPSKSAVSLYGAREVSRRREERVPV